MPYDLEKAALGKALTTGSKLIVTGTVSAVSAYIINFLMLTGQPPSPITPPGFQVPMPAPIALAALLVISGGAGWAGWAYLKQARKLMLRLEFEMNVHPNEIKAALTGSSLASASTLLIRFLCFIALVASMYSNGGLHFFFYLLTNKMLTKFSAFVIIAVIPTIFDIPYILLGFDFRIRYFKPENWSSGSWLLHLFTKKIRQEANLAFNSFQIYSKNHSRLMLPGSISQQEGRRLFNELSESFPEMIFSTVNRMMRKRGYKAFFLGRKFDEIYTEEIYITLERFIDELLLKKIPDIDKESRAVLKDYFMKAALGYSRSH